MLSVREAAQRFPGCPTERTVRHRMTRGVRGVRLRHVWDGHAYYTTEEWIEEYLRDVSGDQRFTIKSATEVYQEILKECG